MAYPKRKHHGTETELARRAKNGNAEAKRTLASCLRGLSGHSVAGHTVMPSR